MKITREEVQRIAALSYLKLTEEEIIRFQSDMSSILSYIDKLNQADTSGAALAAHAFSVPQRLREDTVTAEFNRDEMLKNAPNTSDGFILVPKVI